MVRFPATIPGKQSLILLDDPALNAETPLPLLDAPLTPNALFFLRNNGIVPEFVPEDWTLSVEGAVRRPLHLTLDQLRTGFTRHEVVAVLECAGNGRAAFSPPTDGLAWGPGAVGCARWAGVRMADVLNAAGLRPEACYIAHESPDHVLGKPGVPALSRGIPLAKALAPETLLAWEMNGEPLPRLHGAPLRVVVPGYPGSAWQKWLGRLWVRDCEHDGAKMTGTDYRMPRRPYAPGEAPDPADFAVITDIPVKSLITHPAEGFSARAGQQVALRGFAWSGHVPVASVAVSGDGGAAWRAAELEPGEGPFAWRRFRAQVPLGATPVLMARATDAEGRSQPLAPVWNPRGYLNNAVAAVRGAIAAG